MSQDDKPSKSQSIENYDVAIVGAGFAGLYMLKKALEIGLKVAALEAGGDVGGTWYWNRYPGARCDVESLFYSYSFDKSLSEEWDWTERYAAQPEILEYAQHVSERYNLRKHIRFNSRVCDAEWIESAGKWQLELVKGTAIRAQFVIMATGPLSVPRQPNFKGQSSYKGETYHTGLWPHHDVQFAGKRVGVIGSGSSGIQTATQIAGSVDELYIFQRSAHYSVPAWNRPLAEKDRQEFRENFDDLMVRRNSSSMGIILDTNPLTFRNGTSLSEEDRRAQLEERWRQGGLFFNMPFADVTKSAATNRFVSEFVRNKIRSIIDDPATAEALCAMDFPIGTKRTCVDTGYYEIFNQPNVHLVNTKTNPIKEFTPCGLVAGDINIDLDIIILATGFDAMTGALLKANIKGRDGKSLNDKWRNGACTYLGLAIAGFPNMFTITGPGSPSVFTNMFTSIELHVEWIADCIEYLRTYNLQCIEANENAQENWTMGVSELITDTLYEQSESWWKGSNVEGKPKTFLAFVGGHNTYKDICENVANNNYLGFDIR